MGLCQLNEDAAGVVRSDVNDWLDDDRGHLPGEWRPYRAAFIPKSSSCDISSNRHCVPSDPMQGAVSRALL